ncbi:MAG TPA: cytochrome c oxidase subunit 3 [Chloroflexota bacterium]|nr:cytochrome c oxidase subunit 3 [Chloroflexota bacterium]
MSTDATGLPSEGAAAVSRGLDVAATTAAGAGARSIRNLDDRLTLLLSRMTIASLSFFFACFYFAQVYLQIVNENGMWLPAGITHPSTALGIAEVACIIVAGLAYFWGQWGGLYQRNYERLTAGLSLAALLSVAAVILHIGELHNPGFYLKGGGYVSVFIALEGTFTILLFISTIVLLGMANRARLGLFRQSGIAVEAFGEYFGFLSAIALMNFLALYVQPFFPSAG